MTSEGAADPAARRQSCADAARLLREKTPNLGSPQLPVSQSSRFDGVDIIVSPLFGRP